MSIQIIENKGEISACWVHLVYPLPKAETPISRPFLLIPRHARYVAQHCSSATHLRVLLTLLLDIFSWYLIWTFLDSIDHRAEEQVLPLFLAETFADQKIIVLSPLSLIQVVQASEISHKLHFLGRQLFLQLSCEHSPVSQYIYWNTEPKNECSDLYWRGRVPSFILQTVFWGNCPSVTPHEVVTFPLVLKKCLFTKWIPSCTSTADYS